MSEIINQYELLEPLQNRNAGFSRWTYATKAGKEYFLKEFLDPVYPTDESLSIDLRQSRIRDCEEYQLKKKQLYESINRASHGNIVRIEEFFRYDNHYYIATEKVHGQTISMENMIVLPFEERQFLCKSIAYEMMNLHKMHIVHADIKGNNILLKSTANGKLVGKIIDFDAGFFEDNPPRYEDELGGDQVYLSPEACQFICGDPITLTCKMDVFSLGLLFHEYLTGHLPEFDTETYDYAFEAVLDKHSLNIDSSLPTELQMMIQSMLEADPEKRISMEEVYLLLCGDQPEDEDPNAINPQIQVNKWFQTAGDL